MNTKNWIQIKIWVVIPNFHDSVRMRTERCVPPALKA